MTTYRTNGAWGSGKGANLTASEVDTNFYQIIQRLNALESNPLVGGTIYNHSGATFEIVPQHSAYYVRCSIACVVTVANDDDSGIDNGTIIAFRQAGIGPIVFEDSSGIVFTGKVDYDNVSNGQGSVVYVRKVSEGAWDIYGDLAPSSSS